MKTALKLTAFTLIMVLSTSVYAQEGGRDGGDDSRGGSEESSERRGPPPEAFTICEGKSTGDSCSMTTPHGEMTGSCQMPRGDKLVCAPNDRPER